MSTIWQYVADHFAFTNHFLNWTYTQQHIGTFELNTAYIILTIHDEHVEASTWVKNEVRHGHFKSSRNPT